MIYTSAILHNFCTTHARDEDYKFFSAGSAVNWARFHEKYAHHLCPSCKRRGLNHCIHQATHRVGNAQIASARRVPSVVREELCVQLWERVKGDDPMARCDVADVEVATGCGQPEARCVREVMEGRARATGNARFQERVVI